MNHVFLCRFPFLELESSIFPSDVFVMNLSKMSIALGCLLYESSNVTSSNLVLHSMLSEYFSHKWKYYCKDSHWNDGSHTGENSFIWTKFEKEFPITWTIKDKWSNSNKKEASFKTELWLETICTAVYGGAELGADRNICVRHSS